MNEEERKAEFLKAFASAKVVETINGPALLIGDYVYEIKCPRGIAVDWFVEAMNVRSAIATEARG